MRNGRRFLRRYVCWTIAPWVIIMLVSAPFVGLGCLVLFSGTLPMMINPESVPADSSAAFSMFIGEILLVVGAFALVNLVAALYYMVMAVKILMNDYSGKQVRVFAILFPVMMVVLTMLACRYDLTRILAIVYVASAVPLVVYGARYLRKGG